MTSMVLLSVFIFCFSTLATSGTNALDQVDAIVLRSRCLVKCLTLLHRQVEDGRTVHSREEMTLYECLDDKVCISCLKPCSQPTLDTRLCNKQCESEIGDSLKASCKQSCNFLFRIINTRPGSCPISHVTSSCISSRQCSGDATCAKDEKCCLTKNNCRMCRKSMDTQKGIPQISSKPKILKNKEDGITISWAKAKPINGPVIYVLQSSECKPKVKGVDDSPSTIEWKIHSQLNEPSKIIRDIKAGKIYKYRVLSVSINGSLGPSESSNEFQLLQDNSNLQVPPAPSNFKFAGSVRNRKRLNVKVNWDIPTSEVFRYKITCSEEKSQNKNIFRKTVNGSVYEVTFINLLPRKTYKFQIQAIKKHGSKKIKSARSILIIKTKAIRNIYGYDKSLAQKRKKLSSNFIKPADINSVILSDVYQLINGSLCVDVTWSRPVSLFQDRVAIDKVEIEWRPIACLDGYDSTKLSSLKVITSQTTFNIHSIQNQCKIYKIQIVPLSSKGVKGNPIEKNLQFQEVCKDCKDNLKMKSIREDGPSNLKYIFKDKKEGQKVKLIWSPANGEVINYRLEWTIEDVDTYVKLLPKNTLSFVLNKLIAGAKYDVRVWALMGVAGKRKPIIAGKTTSTHFKVKRIPIKRNADMLTTLFVMNKKKSFTYNSSNGLKPCPTMKIMTYLVVFGYAFTRMQLN